MSATAKTEWYWSDWLGDQEVRRLTPAERGIWIDLIALAAVGSPTGYVCDDRGRPLALSEIARVTNAGSVDEVAKLIDGILEKGAASRDRSGRLLNRRMVRDAEKMAKRAELSAKRAKAGRLGAAHTNLIFHNKPVLPQHVPRHLPGHVPRLIGNTNTNKIRKNPTVAPNAAREAEKPMAPPAETPQEASREEQTQPPRPDLLSRGDLETIFERKRQCTGN